MSPGLMPRPSLSAIRGHGRAGYGQVSPGLMPRPSLSVQRQRGVPATRSQVSPGLMPRPSLSDPTTSAPIALRTHRVSPGLMPRPSLSERIRCRRPAYRYGVSPGLMPRPSLSDRSQRTGACAGFPCVAGVDAPAFVERPASRAPQRSREGVAGVDAPAFVERS